MYKHTVICVLVLLDVTAANSDLEFYKAAYYGNVAYIEQAIAEGTTDINWKNDNDIGRTALMAAALHNQREVAKLLLSAGAVVDTVDDLGRTALYYASVYEGTDEVPSFIIDSANRIYQKDGEDTPVFKPSFREQGSLVKMLIDSHANVNLADNDGITPLHQAAWVNKNDTAQELLQNGANTMMLSNYEGWSPAELARRKGYIVLANYIDGYNYSSKTASTTKSTDQEPTPTAASNNPISLLMKMIIFIARNL